MTGIAQIAMPAQANGSLIRDGDRVIGSALIGQRFTSDRYFQGRPSAAGENGYDASASAATNLAPGSQDLRDAVADRIAASGITSEVPPDLVTTSASGLDPHLSPEAAFAQVARVAAARGLPVSRVRELINANTEGALLGFIGDPSIPTLVINELGVGYRLVA